MVSVNSKRFQQIHATVVPAVFAQAPAAPAAPVEVDRPTYLEVPEFQRVAIIGDYASGVYVHAVTPSITQKRKHIKFEIDNDVNGVLD